MIENCVVNCFREIYTPPPRTTQFSICATSYLGSSPREDLP